MPLLRKCQRRALDAKVRSGQSWKARLLETSVAYHGMGCHSAEYVGAIALALIANNVIGLLDVRTSALKCFAWRNQTCCVLRNRCENLDMATLQTLRERRDALEDAIASGVMSITVDGQTTTFASVKERTAILNRLNDDIARCTGQAIKRPVAATINMGGNR